MFVCVCVDVLACACMCVSYKLQSLASVVCLCSTTKQFNSCSYIFPALKNIFLPVQPHTALCLKHFLVHLRFSPFKTCLLHCSCIASLINQLKTSELSYVILCETGKNVKYGNILRSNPNPKLLYVTDYCPALVPLVDIMSILIMFTLAD